MFTRSARSRSLALAVGVLFLFQMVVPSFSVVAPHPAFAAGAITQISGQNVGEVVPTSLQNLAFANAVTAGNQTVITPQILQAEVDMLKAELAALMMGRGRVEGASATGAAMNAQLIANFTRDLTIGSLGQDVTALQVLLNNNGYPVVASGPGSLNHESDYFGPATEQALMKFQQAYHLPPTGYFGPLTKAYLEANW